jgi:Zn-dependent M28 family amino/carboxypeptidase
VFVWFTGEEIGLLGSVHYVEQALADGTHAKIAAYLNFDMIGSPNYIVGM